MNGVHSGGGPRFIKIRSVRREIRFRSPVGFIVYLPDAAAVDPPIELRYSPKSLEKPLDDPAECYFQAELTENVTKLKAKPLSSPVA